MVRTIENGNMGTVCPYSPRKTRSSGSRFEFVGATVLEEERGQTGGR